MLQESNSSTQQIECASFRPLIDPHRAPGVSTRNLPLFCQETFGVDASASAGAVASSGGFVLQVESVLMVSVGYCPHSVTVE